MVGVKTALVLGIVCFAACASAQTTPFEDALPAGAATGFTTGSYLVNGTGVVYDTDSIIFYLNGTAVGSVPNPHSQGPSVDDPHTHEEFGLPEHDDPLLEKLHKKSPPTPAPEVSEEMFDDILLQLKSQPNPLYNVVIGRKHLR